MAWRPIYDYDTFSVGLPESILPSKKTPGILHDRSLQNSPVDTSVE